MSEPGDFSEHQDQVPDLRASLKNVDDHLDAAESCEKHEDFVSNIDQAISSAVELLKELRELKAEASQ